MVLHRPVECTAFIRHLARSRRYNLCEHNGFGNQNGCHVRKHGVQHGRTEDYFINPGCFGDDVAMWLIDELRKQDLATDEKPSQEDFGWYLNFEVAGTAHTLVIGHRPAGETEAGTWIAMARAQARLFSVL